MTDEPVPISDTAYDFRIDRIADMSPDDVNRELALLKGAPPSHPYLNPNDYRHSDATDFILALRERHVANRPAEPDQGAVMIEQMKADRVKAAESLRREMLASGFDDFQLPEDVQPFHLDIMKRDLAIQRGEFRQALDQLRQEARHLPPEQKSAVQPYLDVLQVAIDTDPDRNPTAREMATDSAFAIHRIIAAHHAERYAAGVTLVNEARATRT